MKAFEYVTAQSIDGALAALAEKPDQSRVKAGGIDLLDEMKERLIAPERVVHIRGVSELQGLTEGADGSVRLGALLTLAEIGASDVVMKKYPALAEAATDAATPAIRNVATLGGNLCQRPRCWYLRRGISCYKSGGSTCPAASGENQYHAILGGGPCFIVHPSDPAVALMALDAQVEIRGPRGERTVPIAAFYVLPSERLDSETVLESGEMVSAVTIPAESLGGPQRYDKAMQRGAWDFALVSLAALRRRDGEIRLVLGGVAPRPWRVTRSVEEDVEAADLAADDIATIAERALYDARPLAKNAYKVELASTVLRRGIEFLTRASS